MYWLNQHPARAFKRGFSRAAALALSLAMTFVTVGGITATAAPGEPLSEKFDMTERETIVTQEEGQSYAEALEEYGKEGLQPVAGKEIVLLPEQAQGADGQPPLLMDDGQNGKYLDWTKQEDEFSWSFDAPQAGLYEIYIEYRVLADESDSVQRRIEINGETPFSEASSVFFPRTWVESEEPGVDRNGDQTSPRLTQTTDWQTVKLTDLTGYYPQGLYFALKQGANTVTLGYSLSGIKIRRIVLKTEERAASYEVKKTELENLESTQGYRGKPLQIQAENIGSTSQQNLRRDYDADPTVYPVTVSHIEMNIAGGYRWRKANESMTWTFHAEQSGVYKLTLRSYQSNYRNNLPVYRSIAIDGTVPYEELYAYPFPASRNWKTVTVSDGNGEPMLFYLTEGDHTLTLNTVMGAYTEINQRVLSYTKDINQIVFDITKVTGNSPDSNFDYEIEKKTPFIPENMKTLAEGLSQLLETAQSLSTGTNSLSRDIASAIKTLNSMANDPESIPKRYSELVSVQESLSNISLNLQEQPLSLDTFSWMNPKETPEEPAKSLWIVVQKMTMTFLRSFTADYSQTLSSSTEDGGADTVIDVWVARGKEWAEQMQNLIDSDFTPNENIGVRVNLMPAGTIGSNTSSNVSPLMLAIISGRAPDVAIGSDASTPVELGIRDAVVDLSQFDDYAEVSGRFLSAANMALSFDSKAYGLPETMDFQILMYRRDILSSLNIPLPDTWDDLYLRTIPLLANNNLQFYMPVVFGNFLLQQDGSFYRDNGSRSGLDSPEAYKAFLQFTQNYTIYDFPESANIYNHFRMGDIPVCIGNFQDYINIMVAAPEIQGQWDVAPLPGTKQDDGRISRTNIGNETSCIILDGADETASWKFLKWWTSESTQKEYADTLEAYIGTEARWASANIKAFTELQWDQEHLTVFKDTWKSFEMVPNVLGGYFTSRHITNAWTRVVMSGQNQRDSLEEAVEEINKELIRKRAEYGLE